MSALEFVAALFDSLAWPVALLLAALMFRTKLIELLSKDMKRLRAGPVEFEWDRTLVETQVQLDQPGVPGVVYKTLPMRDPSEMFVSRLSPRDRVIAAYSEIENALRAKLAALEDPGDLPTEPPGLARLAARHGLVSDETVRAVEGLAVLRNLASHDRVDAKVSEEQVQDYESLAKATIYAIGPPTNGDLNVPTG